MSENANDERAQLQARIHAAKAERERIEQTRAEQAELEHLRQLVLVEERRAKEAPELARLLDEHGNAIAVTETSEGSVVVKRPNHLVYKRFRDSEMKMDDLDRFVRACRVYPDKAEFDRILEALPGVLDRLGDLAVDLAEVKRKEARGK